MPYGVITRTENLAYIQIRPEWVVGSPYRTCPLPPLPILPPMKRLPVPDYLTKKIEVKVPLKR
jgi:hypothetical protein